MGNDQDLADDDFHELEGLLDESLQIVAIRKSTKSGLKLTESQEHLAQSQGIAAELEIWSNVRTYAHSCFFSCTCGNYFEEFRGWYLYQTKGTYGRRLLKADRPGPGKAYGYSSEAAVGHCQQCVTSFQLPDHSEVAPCDLLETLCHPSALRTAEVIV